jgi:hypothetical protein
VCNTLCKSSPALEIENGMGVNKELGSLVELAHNWHTIKLLHGNTRSQLEIGAIRDKISETKPSIYYIYYNESWRGKPLVITEL